MLSIYAIFFALSAAIPPPRGTARAAGIETGRALFIMKQLPPSGGRRQPICHPFPFSGQTGKFVFRADGKIPLSLRRDLCYTVGKAAA